MHIILGPWKVFRYNDTMIANFFKCCIASYTTAITYRQSNRKSGKPLTPIHTVRYYASFKIEVNTHGLGSDNLWKSTRVYLKKHLENYLRKECRIDEYPYLWSISQNLKFQSPNVSVDHLKLDYMHINRT